VEAFDGGDPSPDIRVAVQRGLRPVLPAAPAPIQPGQGRGQLRPGAVLGGEPVRGVLGAAADPGVGQWAQHRADRQGGKQDRDRHLTLDDGLRDGADDRSTDDEAEQPDRLPPAQRGPERKGLPSANSRTP